MKPRYKERFRLQGQVVFTNGVQTGEGRVLDLTSPGCLIESAGIALSEGESLQLNISLHSQSHPLVVTLGVVRWSKGAQFGVEFIKMDGANRLLLNRLVAQHLPDTPRTRATGNSFSEPEGKSPETVSVREVSMKTMQEQRQHPRSVAIWPVTYWNDELFGQGTVLNISPLGCRIAGTMTVVDGMQLKLWISPSNKEEALSVEEARVRWVKDHEFGVEFRRLAAIDHRELAVFLEHAERRHRFQAVQQSCDRHEVAAKPLARKSDRWLMGRQGDQAILGEREKL